jgi:hypothetical protein
MKPTNSRASIWLLLVVVLTLTAARSDAQTPGPSPSPSWWSSYGVITGTNPNDYAAANQGQAKNIALAAVYELDKDIAQFGGSGLDDLTTTVLSGTAVQENDYGAVNLGQLKALVQPFYDRLLALGYTEGPLSSGSYPWVGGTANDYALANLGQLKYLFSFDVTYSATGDSVPDWWLQKYFPGQSMTSGSSTLWDSQVTLLQAYQEGLNPINDNNGQSPTITIVSGAGQTGPPGGFVPAAIVISVSNSSGPLAEAPIAVAVSSGTLWQTSLQSLTSPVTLYTDSNGQAKVYFQLPNVDNATSRITITAGTGSEQTQVTCGESSDNGAGTYVSPFDPSNVVATLNSDGSVDVSWTNNADPNDTQPINIQYRDKNGNWVTAVANVPAGTTSYHVPAQ